jgi:hypothetical protein
VRRPARKKQRAAASARSHHALSHPRLYASGATTHPDPAVSLCSRAAARAQTCAEEKRAAARAGRSRARSPRLLRVEPRRSHDSVERCGEAKTDGLLRTVMVNLELASRHGLVQNM